VRTKQLVFIGILSLAFLSTDLQAEHDEENNGTAKRPESQAPQDCGDQIGEARIRYGGLGLFAATTYDLKIKFERKGEEQCLTLEKNQGINTKLKLCQSDDSYILWNNSLMFEETRLWIISEGIEKARLYLDQAKYRLGKKASNEPALKCAYARLDLLEMQDKAASEAWHRSLSKLYGGRGYERRTNYGEERKSIPKSDRREGYGWYRTFDGAPTYGYRTGSWVIGGGKVKFAW
jgi:hypothetical protein